ncbi:hypothetical protein DTL42_00505 [Bremerella cremea]|uniref:Lipoprotein n=1 Tax=Bremerella cremea TaxID=1031537 RepID=A0A368KXY0_9BACT|nr:hypothetical protein [Bremerella cremea]RCS56097.1 hypothetical protein DTL42_00505 [Bremerella cremea]
MLARTLILLSVFALMTLGCQASRESEVPSAESVKIEDLFSLSVSLPDAILQGGPCVATVTVTNVSPGKASIAYAADGKDIGITLTDARKARVSPNDRGKELLLPSGGIDGSAGIKSLQPGESYAWKIDVAECFDLAPGKYHADFSCLLQNSFQQTSFAVLPIGG